MLLDDAVAASTKAGALLTPGEQKLLFQLAQRVPPGGTIVELGSWMGGSTIMLAAGAMASPDVKVHAVDLLRITDENSLEYSDRVGGDGPDYSGMFQNNLREAGVDWRVEPIRSLTVPAARQWKGPAINLLFIDASHYYYDVALDFIEWSVHCGEGATCAFHDYGREGAPGIKKFVDRAVERGLLKDVGFVDTIAYGTVTTADRREIASRLRLRLSDLFKVEKDRESWYIFSKNHGWMSLSKGDRWGASRYALQAIRWRTMRKEGWLLMACSVLNRRGNKAEK
jgi:predicted O-methyltransferase YrrM